MEDVLRIILAINLIIGGCYRFDEGTFFFFLLNVYDYDYDYYNIYLIFLFFNRYVVRKGLRGTSRERSSDARFACGQPGQ